MDTGSLHALLLQNILDLKSEVDTKANKLINLLNYAFPAQATVPTDHLSRNFSVRNQTQSASVQMSHSSLLSNHLEFGLRWDPEDYTTPTEINYSAPPPLFKLKRKKNITSSMSTSAKSLSYAQTQVVISGPSSSSPHLPEFFAFRQKKQDSMLSLTLPHEKRAKLPSQLQTNVLYDLETIQSAITGSDSQSAINVESNPLIQGLPSITKRSHRVNSIHSKASKRSNNPIKPGGSSVSFDNAYSVQSLQTEGVPHNIDFKINQPSSTSPKSVRISDHSPRQITPRLSATTKSVIPAALPPSFQTTPLPLMPNNKSSSQSSLDVNASAASFDSQDMKEFIQEVKAMAGSPPKKPQDQFETKINASPKDPAGTLFHNDSKEHQQSPTSGRKFEASMPVAPSGTLKRGKPSIGKGNIVGLHNIMSNTSLNNPNERLKQNATLLSFLQDIISYSCLIPAFDSKGRRVTIDQFNGSDFEGISFVMNGLHPKSLFITAFDMLMVIVHICCLGVVPFLVGFDSLIVDEYGYYFSIFLTVVYFLDSVLTLFTPHSKIGRTTIYSIREYESLRPFLFDWMRHWMKAYLLPDLLSTVPFCSILGSKYSALRLLRLIRVFRLSQITARCASFTRIKLYLEGKMGVSVAKILPIGIGIFIFLHFNACVIFSVGQMYQFVGWNQYWLELETARLWDSYLWCFVMAVGNMFPMSYKPQTQLEQFMAIFFIFAGAGLYAVLVGYISSAAISVDNSGRVYNQKMEELKDYIKWRQLNTETKEKLISYYETKYRGKYFEEDTLLGDMNEALRTEVSLHNTLDLITKVPFLRREVGDGRDDIFYARVASVLHIRYYIPGDCVTKEGDSGTDMFFILSGKLDILIGGEVRKSLYDGAYFGEVALINKVLRTATVQAKMPSVLYRLTYQDFHTVINEFADIKIRVSELAFEREKLLMKAAAEKRS